MCNRAAGFVITALFASVTSGQPQAEPGLERAFDITRAETAQNLQEIATDLRRITGISTANGLIESEVTIDDTRRTVAAWNGRPDRARRVAGSRAGQVGSKPRTREYRLPESERARPAWLPGDRDDVVRVFYLTHTETPQQLQEVIVSVRSISGVFRAFTYSASRAMALRGTADQMAVADWLLGVLDKPAQTPGAHEYRLPGAADDVVRVFYLAHAGTAQQLQEIAAEVLSMGEVRRLFIYSTPRAMALSGTTRQIALADRLIQERDK